MKNHSIKKRELKKLEVWQFQKERLKQLLFLLKYPRALWLLLKITQKLMPEEETPFNSAARHSFSMIGGGLVSADDLAAFRHVYQTYKGHMEDFLEAANGNRTKPVVWSEFNLSNEILRAFDIVPYIPESISIMAHHMGTDIPVQLIEEAEAAGLPPEYCSAGKAAIGAWLMEQAPEPDVLISSSHPCDSVVSSYQTLQYLTEAELFTVDTPYWEEDASFEYYARNMRELIGFLEKKTGQKMDWEKLKTICENVNESNKYLQEYSEMARAVPNPTNLTCLLLAWQHSVCCHGTAAGAAYAKEITYNARKRLKQGRGAYPNQKIRIIWFDIPLAFHLFEPWLNQKFGAVTVADFMARVQNRQIDTSSNETMLRDLAKTHLYTSMVRQCRGPADFFTGELSRIIEEYSGDCLIFTRHHGCKGGYGMGKLIRDVCAKSGLPVLFLSADSFDKRVIGEEQVKHQLEDFFRSNGLA